MSILKSRSITHRWLYSGLLVVVAVVAAVVIAFGMFITSLYNNQIKNAAFEYIAPFNRLSTAAPEEFPNMARMYVESFEHKDKLEIQILDKSGNIIITSSGFQPETASIADYEMAKKAPNKSASVSFRSTRGEKVMAGTNILPDYGNGSNGAVRWVVSMSAVTRHVVLLICIVAAVGLILILATIYSGLYFVKSIVIPVKDVTNAARKIAGGDLGSKLEYHRKDEIGELCETINYMAGELEHADTIKNDFISSVSHELRTPLTAIRGWGETVKLSIGSDDELVHKGIDIVLEETGRLSNLVEELLDFSRMQTGRLSLNMREMDLSKCLTGAIDIYEELAKEKGLTFSFHQPDSIPTLWGDPDRLKQVFINIVDNAIKYTTEGSVTVKAVLEEGCVRVICTDTGAGIPRQDVDKVKQRFFKSNKTVRGSGIGLAVADEIIKQHNGLLFIESQENVGTIVTVVLPLPAISEESAAE